MNKLILISILSFLSVFAYAQTEGSYRQSNDSFFDRKAEWWFWYHDPVIEEEKEEDKEKPVPTHSVEEPKPPEPIQAKSESSGPPMLSTAWLSANLDTYRQAAMDNPTEENVSLYWWLERVAKDKADRFTQISRKVFYKDSLLNEDSRRPWSDAGQKFFDEKRKAAAKRLMNKMANEFGLFFFFKSNCAECKDLEPVLKSLEMLYGFNVIPISLDGKPIQGGMFEDTFKPDAGHSKQLNVTRLPTVMIARPPNQFAKIAEGFMPMTELGNVMMLLAEDQGWISEEEYSATLPVNNLLVDPTLELNADTEIEPSELINLIRNNVKRY